MSGVVNRGEPETDEKRWKDKRMERDEKKKGRLNLQQPETEIKNEYIRWTNYLSLIHCEPRDWRNASFAVN